MYWGGRLLHSGRGEEEELQGVPPKVSDVVGTTTRSVPGSECQRPEGTVPAQHLTGLEGGSRNWDGS